MKRYDPLKQPNPKEWLALDEAERLDSVRLYHEKAGLQFPGLGFHAAIHAVVENQIALGDDLPVKATMQRLQAEGLDRHEAIHAVGSVLAQYLQSLLGSGSAKPSSNDAYFADIRQLSAAKWRAG